MESTSRLPEFLFEPAFWIAVYGAVLSTLLACFRIAAHRRDRGAVRLEANIGHVYPDPNPNPPPVLWYSITNVGRRPVRLVNLIATLKGQWLKRKANRRSLFLNFQEFPFTLNEGEARTLHTPYFRKLMEENVRAIYVTDSVGRKWKMRRGDLRRLRRSYREMLARGEQPLRAPDEVREDQKMPRSEC